MATDAGYGAPNRGLREGEGPAAPLSLYIALTPNSRGDLEVISRAAIAWSKTIKEAAFIVDPFLDVRVELVSGTEGSINLNSLIRAIRGTISDPVKLKAIALGVAAYFAAQAGGWVLGKGFDGLWDWIKEQGGYEEIQTLSKEEREDIEKIVSRIIEAKAAREKSQAVFVELSRDSAVTGVGVSLRPGERPIFVVPRSEFTERAGGQTVEEETIHRRTQSDRLTLTLLSPVLSEGEYKWKFQLGAKNLWALMDDPDFKARMHPGSNSAPRMVTGIRMDVDVETVQELKEGVWTTTAQRITKVYGMSEPQAQPSWLTSPTEDDKPQ